MRAIVNVFLKEGVLDSQGKAVHHALDTLHFDSVSDVRIGRQIIMQLDENTKDAAQKRVEEMCEALLANTVIEEYTVTIEES